MKDADGLKVLEATWGDPKGFFMKLREGSFDEQQLAKVLDLLNQWPRYAAHEGVPKRIVSLLWYMPLFISWQKERVQESGGSILKFENAMWRVEKEIEEILGVP